MFVGKPMFQGRHAVLIKNSPKSHIDVLGLAFTKNSFLPLMSPPFTFVENSLGHKLGGISFIAFLLLFAPNLFSLYFWISSSQNSI